VRPYITAAMQIYLIDEPSPFATLVTWERHLAAVRRLPADTLLRAELIEAAECVSSFPEFENAESKSAICAARVAIDAAEPVRR
jgi:hypothetical protein